MTLSSDQGLRDFLKELGENISFPQKMDPRLELGADLAKVTFIFPSDLLKEEKLVIRDSIKKILRRDFNLIFEDESEERMPEFSVLFEIVRTPNDLKYKFTLVHVDSDDLDYLKETLKKLVPRLENVDFDVIINDGKMINKFKIEDGKVKKMKPKPLSEPRKPVSPRKTVTKKPESPKRTSPKKPESPKRTSPKKPESPRKTVTKKPESPRRSISPRKITPKKPESPRKTVSPRKITPKKPTYTIQESTHAAKKWQVTTPDGTTVHFGAKGYQDYTMHHDRMRQDSYIARHHPNEDWTKTGLDTAGFWSRWLLWNKETLEDSARDIEKRFGIKIILE